MAKFILHLGDIHIGSGQRSAEYRKVFDNLFAVVKSFPYRDSLLIVIAGDIFHHKVRYSGEDIDDFNYLLGGLAPLPVIIIPGNHDANLNNRDSVDLITPIVAHMARNNVHYWKDSGVYELAGLKFIHISVFDPASSVEISERMGAVQRLDETILLYHGMINGATFGKFTVRDSRITKDMIERVKLTLAGDIHQHQFITPTAAYSGSLIQQNLGESPVKGIVFWDLSGAKPVGRFVRIENPSGFVKIDLRGLAPKDAEEAILRAKKAAPSTLHKVSVITDSADSELDQQLSKVKDAFGQLDQVNRAQPKTTGAAPGVADDIIAAMREALEAHGATKEQAAEIAAMHANVTRYECRKWVVLNVAFDNLFKYGAGNYIDFTKLSGGISGLIANNRAGKSSILDVIVFGLWGILLRGNKKSMIRHGARSSFLRIEIDVNGTRYAVERRDDRGKHTKVALSRFQDNNWANITPRAIDETYRQIKQLIGSLDQFLLTGLYYDSYNDVIKMNKGDRMRILPELFGLTNNESILRDIKAKLRGVKAEIDKLAKPRSGTVIEERNKVKAELDDLTRHQNELQAEMTALDRQINELRETISGVRPRAVIEQELKYLNDSIATKRAELAQLKPPAAAARTVKQIDAELSAARKALRPLVDIASLASQRSDKSQALERLNAEDTPGRETQEANQLMAELKRLDAELSKIKYQPEQLGAAGLKARVEKLKEGTSLAFNDACRKCQSNKAILAKDLAECESELTRLTAAEEAAQRSNAEAKKREDALRAQISAVRTELERATKMAQGRAAAKVLAAQIASLDRDIERAKDTNKEHEAQSAIVARLERELAEAQRAEIVSVQIKQKNDDLVRLSSRLKFVQDERARCEEQFEKTILLDELTGRRQALMDEIVTVVSAVGKSRGVLDGLEREVEILTEYNKKYPALKAEHDKLKLYSDCLGSSGLKSGVIRRNIDRVIGAANGILASVTDFRLKCEVDDGAIDIFLVEHVDQEEIMMPVDMASGFQKFIISIVFRLALTSSVYSSPNFIFIDEGFGCMDKSNLAKVSDLFVSINSLYKFIFIISHLDDLHSVIDKPLYILTRQDKVLGIEVSHIDNHVDSSAPVALLNELEAKEEKKISAQLVGPTPRLNPARVGHSKPSAAPKEGKVCQGCGELKALKDYGKNAKQPDGLKVICKECFRERRTAKK